MAYVPMTAGGGGTMTETTLWTNASPTTAFNEQDITISDDMNNYDYLKITVNYNNTSSTTLMDFYVKVADFKTMTGAGHFSFPAGLIHTNSVFYFRPFTYTSDTKVHAGLTRYGSSTSGAALIPVEIKGLKYA